MLSQMNPNLGKGTSLQKYTETTNFEAQNRVKEKSILAMNCYLKFCIDELRMEDYAAGRHVKQQGQLFGQTPGGGLFGNQSNKTGGLFGNQTQGTGNRFFGQQNTGTGGLFGNQQPKPQSTLFGGNTSPNLNSSFFGRSTGGGGGGGIFGPRQQQTGTGLFGNQTSPQSQTGGIFGSPSTQGISSFGVSQNTGGMGLFGNQSTQPQSGGLFGNQSTQGMGNTGLGGGLFQSTTGVFGNQQPQSRLFNQQPSGGLFNNQQNQGIGNTRLFAPQPTSTGLFQNQSTNQPTQGSLFQQQQQQQQQQPQQQSALFGESSSIGSGIFGGGSKPASNGLFSGFQSKTPGGIFGGGSTNTNTIFGGGLNTGGGVFGKTPSTTTGTGSIFSSTATPAKDVFGNTSTSSIFSAQKPSIFSNTSTVPTTNLFGTSAPTTPANQHLFANTNIFGSSPSLSTQPPLIFGTMKLNPNTTQSTVQLPQQLNLFEAAVEQEAPERSILGRLFEPASNKNRIDLSHLMPRKEETEVDSVLSKYHQPILKNPEPEELSEINEADILPSPYPSPLVPKRVIDNLREEKPRSPFDVRKPTMVDFSDFRHVTLDSFSKLTQLTEREEDRTLGLHLIEKREKEKEERVDKAVEVDEEKKDTTEEVKNMEETKENPVSCSSNILPILTRKDYYCKPSLEEMSKMSEYELSRIKNLKVAKIGKGAVMWASETDVRRLNFDNLVAIRDGEIWVYPGRQLKPPQGQELNKPAVVAIKVPFKYKEKLAEKKNRDKLERSLRDTATRQGHTHVSFDFDTYLWQFKVPHFDVNEPEL